MSSLEEKPTMITLSCSLQEGEEEAFHQWQARLNAAASLYSGFISSEVSFAPKPEEKWLIVQRFKTPEELNFWEESLQFKDLFTELEKYAIKSSIKNDSATISDLPNGVTEIFVTEVSPGKEAEFQRWNAKINEEESKFPGFRGAYLQSPGASHGRQWITMIRFDTTENLDRWLASTKRKDMLEESKVLISSIEGHRMASPYAGWFSSVSKGEAPPGWKQGMLVLLVLYPVVMLEFILLAPLQNVMNLSLRTFIGNALSVALLTYPLTQIAIYYLKWWLTPAPEKKAQITFIGCVLLIILYALQVIFFSLIF